MLLTIVLAGFTDAGLPADENRSGEAFSTLDTRRFFDGSLSIDLGEENGQIQGHIRHTGAKGAAGRKLPEEVQKRLPMLFLEKHSGADDKREEKPRFKGVELYSWKENGGEWVFVLLSGTNRNKTKEEVKKAKNRIKGTDDLKKALARLAVKEHVFWTHRIEGFEFPPETVRKEIQKAAKEADIELLIQGPKE